MTDGQANARIRALLDKADRLLADTQGEVEARLLRAYRAALDDVQNAIARVFAETDAPTVTQLRKFGRLTSIEKQIAERIKRMTQVAVNITSQAQKNTFTQGYVETTKALELGTGMALRFDKLASDESIRAYIADDTWIDALKESSARLGTAIERELETTLRMNARSEIVSGVARGKPWRSVANAIEERFNVEATRAKRITFTETHKAFSAGRLDGIHVSADAADRLGFEVKKVWKHNPIGEARPGHLAADGQRVDAKGVFTIAAQKGGTFTTEAPGLSGLPEEDIYCHCSAQIEVEGIDNRGVRRTK